MKPLNILSLFDGISAGQLALTQAGIPIRNYFASEIEPSAIKITQANFPDTIQLGDVTKQLDWHLPHIDLIIAGSPCQGFSRAGLELNFADPRSKLFFEFIDALEHRKPSFFMLENVKMRKKHRDVITYALGETPIEMDSRIFVPQHRERLYWYNFPKDSLLNIPYPPVSLPDIIEPDARPIIVHNLYGGFQESTPRVFTKYSPTLRTSAGGGHIPSIMLKNSILRDFTDDEVVSYLSNASLKQLRIMHKANPLWRKLSIRECERLQGFPDGYVSSMAGLSDTAKYNAIGNSWTVPVVKQIFESLLLLTELD